MRKLVVCLGVVLILVVFATSSQASIVIEQTNSVAELFNGNSATPGVKTVTFASGLFTGPNDIIEDIEISISFSKLATSSGTSPKYNEISFSLSTSIAEVPAVGLIKSGPGSPPYTGSFSTGFTGDPGFNGTLNFNDAGTYIVNAVPPDLNSKVPPTLTYDPSTPATIAATTYRPIDSLAAFIGKSGAASYTLNIVDSANSTDPGLQFTSFTVRITAVPEPTSLACLGLLATAGAFVRRRRVR